ncbi:xanthine dehydrogenase family protein molybdopterin-binding subunit [Alphaproteobacteria bacterium KMM 3653]|uniref:Xanthine dehydrogenase family protein molybdopterin-binding subunit n=1 Tax=Harenicola maris TaxID=2841044 RepID=A0AAP2CKF1_9RHOB|nr:xanthine dehydrogenase family protein molybdopterin-binding subunit [Harenicola maris]
MDKFGKAQAAGRLEDNRLLTGAGRYVDDIAPAGALRAYFLRAPVAHGEITELDVSEARDVPGVAGVFTAADLAAGGVTEAMGFSVAKNRDGSRGAAPRRPLLAEGRMRFVGEPVAMVVASSMEAAKDGAEAIALDYDELPVHLALEVGGEAIHPEAPANLAFDWGKGDAAAVEAALGKAAHRLSYRISDNRVICNPMETRAAWAEMGADGRLTFCFGGQGVWDQKAHLARTLGMAPEDIRVLNPDVGGGFGTKAFDYPEYHAIAFAARALGRPVRWMAERGEGMLSDNAGRDLVTDVEMGFDADHRLVAYRVENTCNLGAYNSAHGQFIQSELFAKVYPGVYDIAVGYLGAKGIYTNTTPVDAYRGAGRPEAIYVLERAMDYAARDLGADAWALRRRNFIGADAFPYRSVAGETYDCGDFHRVLARVEEAADRGGFAARRALSEAAGFARGLGLAFYIESILGDPSETAAFEFEADGTLSLFVGTQSGGQAHETVFSRVLAERTGVPVEKINFVQGDSDRIASGGGTGGSRSGTVQATAVLGAVDKLVAAFAAFLEAPLGGAVTWDEEAGVFRAEASNQTPGMLEVAEMARAAGREDLLRHEARITLQARSFPNGAHVAEVEVDRETGVLRVDRYTIADDFGNLMNPVVVTGQVHGGVAQAIGQAVTEQVVYDADGQLLSASFMDYAMPRADDVPMIEFHSVPVPTTMNPLGMKGCGEAGTVGGLAAIANAVSDALDGRAIDMPFTPHRLWSALRDGPQEGGFEAE